MNGYISRLTLQFVYLDRIVLVSLYPVCFDGLNPRWVASAGLKELDALLILATKYLCLSTFHKDMQ